MSDETDKMAREALEKLEGRRLSDADTWQIKEPTIEDPDYLRGYIEGLRNAHERSIALLINALQENRVPSVGQ